MNSQTRPSLLAANLMCMASMFFWAAGLPAAEPLIAKLPPLSLTAARMTLAALSMLPLWVLTEGLGALRAAHWGKGLLVGASTIGLGAFLLVLGQSFSDPVTVAIIAASMPVVGIAIELVLDGRKLTATLVGGMGLSLLGGLLALDQGSGSAGLGWGALLCLASVLAFTLGSRLTVTSFPTLSPLGRTALTLTGAAAGTLAASALYSATGGARADWAALGLSDWGALLIFSVGSLGISQLLWIMSVGNLGIGLAALHINAAPFYVMLILFALGQDWNWMQTLGAAIVGLGVLLAQNLITFRRG